MQSVQGNSVRGLSDSLERRSPDKGLRTSKLSECEEFRSKSPERSSTREGSQTPTPTGRSTPSHLHRPILGENTPPSATVLALQSMRNRVEMEAPLTSITNGSTALARTPLTFDAISSQILSLTSIATNLQREMAQLSRRSKDNATDLISLKEATNSRDEDIRKSLKDLVSGLDGNFSQLRETAKSPSNLGLYLDNKAYNSPSGGRKNFSLPRIPSPNSFSAAIDRDLAGTPSLVSSSDGAASIALLEKVLREMSTKDGLEKIMDVLEEVKDSVKQGVKEAAKLPSKTTEHWIDPAMMKKLDELLTLMRDSRQYGQGSRALVRAQGDRIDDLPAQIDLYFENDTGARQVTKATRDVASPSPKSNQNGPSFDFVNEEIMKMLKNVRQSISQSGGMTNEIKALVRELRGEVLGMGREIARKLEQAESTKDVSGDDARGPGREEIAEIVDSGLHELKQHMYELVKENRRQSAASARSVVDTQEVVHAVRSALAEMPRPKDEPVRNPDQEQEQLIVAVKEAWEDCKPDIALEHFGLERDEILETLKEGLKSFQLEQNNAREIGVSYDDVLAAVQTGLADFKPPEIHTEASITREEILMSVRECLQSFDFPVPAAAPSSLMREGDLSYDDMLDAVKKGLEDQPHAVKEVEFNRDDLFNAVKQSLEGARNPMYEFLETMKTEFKQYSAANGKDTEQVLDAMKDGFEELRGEIESYVDRAADVTGKDEIIEEVRLGVRALQADLEKLPASKAKGHAVDTPELLDAMEKKFEHLRDTISKSVVHDTGSSDKEEILDAIRDVADSERGSSLGTEKDEIVRSVKEELEHLRTTLAGTLVRGGSSFDREEILETIREGMESSRNPRRTDGNESILSNTSELLDAFQEGVDGLRADMQKLADRPVDISTSYEILDTLKAGLENVRADIGRLHQSHQTLAESSTARGAEVVVHDENLISTEIEGLKVMITQLRIKVEALDMQPPPAPMATFDERHVQKDDLNELHHSIKAVHSAVNDFSTARNIPVNEDAAKKEDTDALETLLRNIRAKLDDLSFPELESMARETDVHGLEDLIKGMKDTVEDSAAKAEKHSVSAADFSMVEVLLKEVAAGVDELQSKVKVFDKDEDRITKADIQAVETLCLDTKTQFEELLLPDPTTLPTKTDIGNVLVAMKALQEQVEADSELTGQAFEARKIEHGGLANKIDEAKDILSDIRAELIEKLDGSAEGIHELGQVLDGHRETLETHATAASLKELADLVNREFERHMDHHTSARREHDERAATILSKHETTTGDLKAKIEDKFDELMTKYDDAQIANDSKIKAIESRDSQHLEVANHTKAVADDIKLLVDTLGTTVTETCDRMSDDAKTVYNRVDEANGKLDELHNASASEHNLTRDEVAKALAAALRLEATMSDNQPAIMAAINDVRAIVTGISTKVDTGFAKVDTGLATVDGINTKMDAGFETTLLKIDGVNAKVDGVHGIANQHFDHAKQESETYARSAEEFRTEMRDGINGIPTAIPPLLPAIQAAPLSTPLVREVPVQERYDDSQVHDKLNVLIGHASTAKEAFSKLEAHHNEAKESLAGMQKLEQIHEQMMATAGEVSAMVATQTRLMSEHHGSRSSEATEAGIALEKRIAQKEKVEIDIIALNQEKDELAKSVAALKREQAELNGQTKRLTREVAKLETALNIRQEEMRDMNARAETLERRILEGVMNHARSVNIPKPTGRRKMTAAERDASMSLKRVPSSTSTITSTKTSVKDGSSTIGSAAGMMLKKRTPLTAAPNSMSRASTTATDRRILSSSHVQGNRPRDAPERALMLAPAPNTGLVSLKRSHSVKSNTSSYFGGPRKASWNPATDLGSTLADKENHVLPEEDEDEHLSDDEATSDAGTERRSSFTGTGTSDAGTSYMYTDSLAGTSSSLSYGTGSSLSTNGGRTASYASSVGGAVGGRTDSIEEEDESESEHPTDSGVGSSDHQASQADQSAQIMALLEAPPAAVNEGKDNSMALTTLEGLDEMSDLQPPRLITGDGLKYRVNSDSGIGSEPPTADLEGGAAQEYFSMTKQDIAAGRN